MRVSFVRTAGARDRIYVERDDGSEASWQFPTYGDAPPHDLVHLVLEAELGLDDALWGRVAAGANLGAIAAAASRTRTGGLAEKYAALGDLRAVLVSEAVAAAVSGASAVATDRATRRRLLDESAARFGVEVPAAIDGAALERVCDRLAAIAARWRAIGAGPAGKGALVLTWPGAQLIDRDAAHRTP